MLSVAIYMYFYMHSYVSMPIFPRMQENIGHNIHEEYNRQLLFYQIESKFFLGIIKLLIYMRFSSDPGFTNISLDKPKAFHFVFYLKGTDITSEEWISWLELDNVREGIILYVENEHSINQPLAWNGEIQHFLFSMLYKQQHMLHTSAL